MHERHQGAYDFSGRLDIVHFCRLAPEQGLHVFLRTGPYVCGEINVPGIRLRTRDGPYLREIERARYSAAVSGTSVRR